jgi:hypothetical protein
LMTESLVGVGIVFKHDKHKEIGGLTVVALVPGGSAAESGQVLVGSQVRRRTPVMCGVCRRCLRFALQCLSVSPPRTIVRCRGSKRLPRPLRCFTPVWTCPGQGHKP